MTKYLEEKFKIISFFLITLVVLAHSYNVLVTSNFGDMHIEKGYSSFIQVFFNHVIARVTVPLFFSFSAFLFFLNLNGSVTEFMTKFKKRVNTLAIPFLVWSAWGILMYFILQNIPQSAPFFTRTLIVERTWSELISMLLINPIPYQLWYVRDLMIMIILSPLIFYLVHLLKFIPVIICLIAWFLDIDFIVFNNQSLLFFMFGAYVCLIDPNILLKEYARGYWLIPILWLLFAIGETVLLHLNYDNILISIMHKVGMIIGFLAVWIGYDLLFRRKVFINNKYYFVLSYTFFVYAFHEPMLTIFKKAFFFILGNSQFMSLVIFFLAPSVTIALGVAIGFYLNRLVPRFYGVVSGGR